LRRGYYCKDLTAEPKLETILFRLGFVKRQDSTSHARFTLGSHILIIPKRKPFVKPIYVAQVVKLLEAILDEDSAKGL
jgi:hypothetical protein